MENESEIDVERMKRSLIGIVLSAPKVKANDFGNVRVIFSEKNVSSYLFFILHSFFKKNRIRFNFEDLMAINVMYSGPTITMSAQRANRVESVYYNFSRNTISR